MNTHIDDGTPHSGRVPALDKTSERWLGAVATVEESTALDPAIRALQRGIRGLPLGALRGLLRGEPLGHPAHPMLVQVPMGCWLSAAVLDTVPGAHRYATVLTAVGLAGVAPAAAAGWADWAELPPRQARVGVAHALANAAAVGCYAVALSDRLRGRGARGRLWSLAGLGAAAVSGALGGHIAYGDRMERGGTGNDIPPGIA
ncbi:DUF2231 domain-containing protein [Streptomyces avidinii]|uniref:Membrane protein n=1 Tax=Streptomyces avidinii TaxID=1895 RepID=A0ABS4KWI9_STRAV|nr:DUF2231 domain-containing protein [Streptomyces avidinii]MBP2034395.1 putative membrane protein [Streptomyces avidinii]GGY86005.1 membrane protein [Streptomyces avidinii]